MNKRLSIEEKAKAYDEAVERAESIYNETAIPSATTKGICTYIFPELKESKDERIRKELIEFVKSRGGFKQEYIAWLEKQSQVKEFPISQHENKTCKENEDSLTREDEKIRKAMIKYFTNGKEYLSLTPYSREDYIAWLEKKGEQKPAWREEDEMMLQYAIEHFERQKRNCIEGGGRRKAMQELIEWLKSLRPQDVCTYNPYKAVVESIAEMCKHYDKATDLQDFYDNVKVKCKDAKEYDSLYPQSQWKPSGKQLEALKEACDEHWEPDGLDPLYTLYQDLKKMKGE